jgi:hypothetical protein
MRSKQQWDCAVNRIYIFRCATPGVERGDVFDGIGTVH